MRNTHHTAMSDEHRLYLKQIKCRDRFITISRIILLVFLLFTWEIAAHLGWIDAFITSSPSRMVATIARLYADGSLFLHIGTTLYETIAGFMIGTIAGILIAILLWWSPTISRILDPYLVVLNALPKIALGPILIVWIGAGALSIIVMGILISFVVTVMTVLNGFFESDNEKHLLMKTLGATKMQVFYMIILPSSIPTLMSAIKISIGMTWVGIIVGEYLVSKAGLGYLIVYGGQVFQLDLVMTSIFILCIFAAIMYYGAAYLEKKLVHK